MFKDLLYSFAAPVLNKVTRYKNKHRGESCYLIGDGVSLKWFDLNLFKDKISIPCGFLPFHKDFEKLNAPYLMLIEPYWFYPIQRTYIPPVKVLKNYIQNMYREEAIEKYHERMFFLNLSNYPALISKKNITYMFKEFPRKDLPSNYLSRRLNVLQGSVRASIALAIYMGFEDINLLGYDYTHLPARTAHWYEKGYGSFEPHLAYQEQFFIIAQEYSKITSITLDGVSEFIKSITYQHYTGKAPNFRENTDLVDARHLKMLSTWPMYHIF